MSEDKFSYFMMFAYPPLLIVEYPNDLQPLILEARSLEYRPSMSNDTTVNQFVLDLPAFKPLRDFCHKQVAKYVLDVLIITDHEILIKQSWLNKTLKNKSHPKHYHLNSMVSGVFYLEGPDPEECPIVFDTPRIDPFPVRPEPNQELPSNEFLNDSYKVPTIPGHLLLFPSTLHHYVPTNLTDTSRVSLSFNTFPKLPVGSVNNSTYLEA